MGWYVIVGTIPIGIVGLLLKDLITGDLRSLWVVADRADPVERGDVVAERRRPRQDRGEQRPHPARRDHHRPGAVRRPGPGRLALRRHDLGGPAARPRPGHRDPAVASSCRSRRCWPPASSSSRTPSAATSASARPLVGTVVSFVVAYASIAWLLRFVAAPLDRVVRALPGRPRRAAARAAGHRRDDRRPDAAGYSQPDFLKTPRAPPRRTTIRPSANGVAEVPVQLGHVLEVHAVDAGDQRRRRRPADPGRDLAHVVVLLDARSAPGGRRRRSTAGCRGCRRSRRPG